jgi:hypothetical protein
MGVGIILELAEPVTIRLLRLFLSMVDDADVDVDADLRVGCVSEIETVALAVHLVGRGATGGA